MDKAAITKTSAPLRASNLTHNTYQSRNRLQGKDVGIPVRRLGQTYGDDIPTWWLADNPFLTLFFAGFSAKLPEGEAQFIHSVRLFQEKITDPVLQAQIRAFIGQEGHHSREHEALNKPMIRKGFRLDKIEETVRSMNAWMRKNQSPAKQLAGTVCGEHLTALLADFALQKDPWLLASTVDPVRKIWAWHCIEETEHKGVAFDVYEQLVGDRELLRRTMVEITVLFMATNFVDSLRMLPRKHWFNLKMWRESAQFLSRMARLTREDYMDFYKPDFHPWDHDNREAVKVAKREYLGEDS